MEENNTINFKSNKTDNSERNGVPVEIMKVLEYMKKIGKKEKRPK